MGEIASPSQLRMSFLRWALVTVPLVLLLGIGSGRLSNSGYDNPWFDALVKPALMPPGWVFGVAWTILYILLGLAFAYILQARGARGRGLAIGLFVVQLALNLAWSPLFFAAHMVTASLALIGFIFVVALATALTFYRIRTTAGLLMAPYLAWLIFAAFLNYQTMTLNPDAETLVPEAGTTQITF
jgi:tryptophan-rich sensory protein